MFARVSFFCGGGGYIPPGMFPVCVCPKLGAFFFHFLLALMSYSLLSAMSIEGAIAFEQTKPNQFAGLQNRFFIMNTQSTHTINDKKVTAHKVAHDVNGNPRYVVHYLDLLTEAEQADLWQTSARGEWVNDSYKAALAKARKIGGKAYRAKWFGGGIVFQSYSLESDLAQIINK